jgi:hypothetical protein
MAFTITAPTLRFFAAAMALGLAITLLPAESTSAAGRRVKGSFFGMTAHTPETWPSQKVGALRLWDSGVTWRQIELQRGVFDFSRLDAQITAARRHGARPLVVLGQTPRFHAKAPNATGYYGPGASSMPLLTPWRKYVAKVVRRYKGRGVDYQVWNEANISGFWSGTPAQMATLTKVTYKVVKNNDARAKVVGPALATRLVSQRRWLRDYYGQRTGGAPVARWINVVSLNLYPLPKGRPEHSMTLLAASRIMLGALGVRKPIWNTEINYGLQTGGGGTAVQISERRQAAYVARTFVLNAAKNIAKVFWYSWEQQRLANTRLTYANGTISPAGVAFGTVQTWLRGARINGCSRDSRGTYTCTVTYADGVRRIYWNPSSRVTIRTAPGTTHWVNLAGELTKIGSGKGLAVNYAPKMVRSRR